jgi:predicted ester cyclase
MTQIDDNKALVIRFYEEVINHHRLDLIAELLAPAFAHNGETRGASGQRQAVEALIAAMPDIRVETLAIIGEGDLVVVRQVWMGTQSGPLMGSGPSGRRLGFTSMAMLRIADGRIAEAWVNEDDLGLMRQLGREG